MIIAETALASPDSPDDNETEEDNNPILQYEERALNYLVNEYLLMQNYKLTSVTFAEENEDQVLL